MQSTLDSTATTLTAALTEQLRTEIAHGWLKPGERVTEDALAERFGVSRTPVREALRMLTREALLTHRPNAGYAVAEVSVADMDDLYAVRVGIEEQVARHIVARNAYEPLRELRTTWAQRPPEEHADALLVLADERFHETLADASGSGVLAEMLRNINARLHVLRIRDFVDARRVQRTFDQHLGVIDALEDRDARLGAALLRSHIWESHAHVRAAYLADQQLAGERHGGAIVRRDEGGMQ